MNQNQCRFKVYKLKEIKRKPNVRNYQSVVDKVIKQFNRPMVVSFSIINRSTTAY